MSETNSDNVLPLSQVDTKELLAWKRPELQELSINETLGSSGLGADGGTYS